MNAKNLNTWHLIETLTNESMTLISSGGNIRDWTNVERLAPDAGIDIRGIVEEAKQSLRNNEVKLVGRRSRRAYTVKTVPVLGPSGEAHGVQLWIGDEYTSASAPRIVSGIAWLLERTVITQTLEAALMSGVDPAVHVPERTPAEYNAKAVRFDGAERLFTEALMPEHGRQWNAPMSVLHANGQVMNWHCWARGRTDAGNAGLRLLWHDVTDTTPPALPTLIELGFSSGLESSGTRVGVFDAPTGTLTMWIPKAPNWVQWRDIPSGRDVLHSDDHRLLQHAVEVWETDSEPIREVVRVRSLTDSGCTWRRAELEFRPYPGQLRSRLVLATFPAILPAGSQLHLQRS